MKSCPTCRTGLPEATRVCRACYTVLPRDDQQKHAVFEKGRTKAFAGLKYVLLIVIIGLAAWSYRVDLKMASSESSWKSSWEPARSASQRISGSDLPTQRRSAGKALARQPTARTDGYCAVDQRVRNIGAEAVSRVVLRFIFKDAAGARLGGEATSAIATVLPVGAEETLSFRLPCPDSVANVEVRAPAAKPGGERVALVATGSAASAPPNIASPGVLGPEYAQVAIEFPDLSFCPVAEPCELEITFDHGGKSMYPFRRYPQDSAQLVANDPVLVGHLRTGKTATLHIPVSSGEDALALTWEQLRSVESPGFFARWFAKLI